MVTQHQFFTSDALDLHGVRLDVPDYPLRAPCILFRVGKVRRHLSLESANELVALLQAAIVEAEKRDETYRDWKSKQPRDVSPF